MLSDTDRQKLKDLRASLAQQPAQQAVPEYIPRANEKSAADNYDAYAEAEKRRQESARRLREKLAARAKDRSRYNIKSTKPAYFRVSFFKIKNYVGRDIKVTGINGAVHEGILNRYLPDENRIIIRKQLKNGTADFVLHRSDIKQILVKK